MSGHKSAVGKSKDLYMYSISPFYQRPFRGFFQEITHSFKSHFGWGIFAAGISFGAYSIVKWANADYHLRGLKDPEEFENEVIEE